MPLADTKQSDQVLSMLSMVNDSLDSLLTATIPQKATAGAAAWIGDVASAEFADEGRYESLQDFRQLLLALG